MKKTHPFVTSLFAKLRTIEHYFQSLPQWSAQFGTAEIADDDLLTQLVKFLQTNDNPTWQWVFLATLYSTYPTTADFQRFRRRLKLLTADELATALLGARNALIPWPPHWGSTAPALITPGLLVAVTDQPAGSPAAVPQVVANAIPHWRAKADLTIVAWNNEVAGFETVRRSAKSTTGWEFTGNLVVPAGGVLIIADPLLGSYENTDRLSCLARYSGVRVNHIGYDLSQITQPEFSTEGEINSAVAYVSVLKFSNRVAAISDTALNEFRGLNNALRTQGLNGPELVVIPLPAASDLPNDWNEYAASTLDYFEQ